MPGWPANTNNLALIQNPKDATSFHSGCWNTSTNPDLAFFSINLDSRLPDKHLLEKFPRSQHRPLLIDPPRFACPVPSNPIKLWNFRKAKWNHYISFTNKLARTLPPPDSPDMDHAYWCFCNAISTAAKKCIPRGRRNNRLPCCNAKCENLYQAFLQYPEGHESSRAATAWSEAVQNIDFSHSCQVAWSTLNNLTGRSRQSPCQFPVSANAIASQLVKNAKYGGANQEISWSVMQELSDLCRATALDSMNISWDFSPREFATAFHHLKPGKSPVHDSICPELLIQAGSGLKFWLRGFLSSCLR